MISTVSCCFAMHGCAWPVRSTKSPSTANTWSSSVNCVHSESAGAGTIGQNVR